jgi:hypothetical protein
MNKIVLIVLLLSFSVSTVFAQNREQNSNKNLNLTYPSLTVIVNTNPSPEYLFLGPTTSESSNLLILDNDLIPLFYKKITDGSVFDFKLQRNGKLTYNIATLYAYSYGMDSSGIVDKQYITPTGYDLDIHDLQVMEDGTYYILGREYITIDMSQYVPGGDTAAILTAQTIHHMDGDDNELWRWRSIDHYDILDVAEYIDLTRHSIDWTHCNSVEIDNDGNIIISTKNFDEITKISRQTGNIIWRLGGERNQFQFINDNRGFGGQHDARVLSNGNIAIFDNGFYLIPEYSSYVEYEIDEQNYTATLIRRYSRNGTIFSAKRGGVQELPNGNILVSWDGILDPFISEINPEDSTVYEVKYDNHVSQYRAYKFSWKSNLFTLQYDSLDFGIVNVGNSSGIDVKIYNRRDDPVIINEVFNSDSSFYVNENLPINIASHDSIEITIIFEPFEEGSFTDKVNFRYVTDTLLIAQQIFVQGETSLVTEVEELNDTYSYSLFQNYPNPFNPSTTIKFSLPESANVTLRIYNTLGQKITELVNTNLEAGWYNYQWDANNMTTGIYIYELRTDKFVAVKKMILLQ